ncbi:MAG: hypothetical protein ACT4O9_09565 [Blastocatellia bacterium]
MWINLTIVASLFVIGNIVFGHFEEGTPKWRRIAKFFVFMAFVALISHFAGSIWVYIFLGTLAVGVLVIHIWWLPKKGINGWTGEPKGKYYELRGWKTKDN